MRISSLLCRAVSIKSPFLWHTIISLTHSHTKYNRRPGHTIRTVYFPQKTKFRKAMKCTLFWTTNRTPQHMPTMKSWCPVTRQCEAIRSTCPVLTNQRPIRYTHDKVMLVFFVSGCLISVSFLSGFENWDFSLKLWTNKIRDLYLQRGKRFDVQHLHQCSQIRFVFVIIWKF